jgi:membrane fusion protein (multidrug efflux system)
VENTFYQTNTMKKNTKFECVPNRNPVKTAFCNLFAGSLALLLLAGCNGNKNDVALAPGESIPVLPVQVLAVKQQMVPASLEAVGQAEGSLEVEVRARVSGILERKLYDEGKYVQAGDPLYKIERAPYEIALQRAKANFAQRQAQLEQARREAQRLQPLAKDKAIAQREYDDAVTNTHLAEAAADSARAEIRDAELNLSYTSIVAPISGITGRSQKSQGALMTAGSDSLLTTIAQTDPIWVRFSISESELVKVRASTKPMVNVLGEDGKEHLMGGELNFAGSTVDTLTGAVQLRAAFHNPQLHLLPGQFVRVQILTDPVPAYKIPQTAVAQNEDGHMVWVAREGKAVSVPIKTGSWLGKDWVVFNGLSDGDLVIVDNLIKLSPETPVEPQPEASAGSASH